MSVWKKWFFRIFLVLYSFAFFLLLSFFCSSFQLCLFMYIHLYDAFNKSNLMIIMFCSFMFHNNINNENFSCYAAATITYSLSLSLSPVLILFISTFIVRIFLLLQQFSYNVVLASISRV